MNISSQAGLASIQRNNLPFWEPNEPNLIVTLNTASFELRLSKDGHWYVVHSQSPGYSNIDSLLGRGFEPNRNPWEHDKGYPARIQQALNEHVNRDTGLVTESFGRPITPQLPITER